MICCTVELKQGRKRRMLHRIEIQNDQTGDEQFGNYRVTRQDGTEARRPVGRITEFPRQMGALALVTHALSSDHQAKKQRIVRELNLAIQEADARMALSSQLIQIQGAKP